MFGLILSVLVVVATVVLGAFMRRFRLRGSRRLFVGIVALSFCLLLTGAICSLVLPPAFAAESGAAESKGAADVSSNGMGFLGMALATGLACVGAGIAVGSVGSAALGLVGEQPEAIGTTLIYVGLAEGIAIYGIVISMLIFSRLA